MKNNHVSMLHGVDRRQVLSILTGFGATGTQLLGTFTSQFFFDESVTDAVFAQSPYSSRRSRDTRNSNDGIYLGAGSRAITGRDDQEALVPWSAQTSASGTLLFDEATATTGFAFVNPLSLAGTVTIVAYRSDGTPIGSAAVTVGGALAWWDSCGRPAAFPAWRERGGSLHLRRQMAFFAQSF